MSAGVSAFGSLSDGRGVEAVRLGAAGGLQAEVLTWGATLRSLKAPSPRGPVEVLLQLPTLADYVADTRYLNPVIGRCANRIGGAAFPLDGRTVHVTANEGENCLHGGAPGWHKRLWTLQAAQADRCTLAYTSPDGESGFPGEVRAEVEFSLLGADTLELTWRAQAGSPTPVNMTHHLYFSLGGDAEHLILKDSLGIGGSAVTPVCADLIPTGEVRSVDGSVLDLRSPRVIEDLLARPDDQMRLAGGVDLNWLLDPQRPACTLSCPHSGVVLEITTDQPGLQVYTGQGLSSPFVKHQAIVLEPQGLPDAVNHPNFPSVILRPGEAYERRARYRFTTA